MSEFYSTRVQCIQKPPDALRDSSIIKLAVKTDITQGKVPQLLNAFDQKRPLAAIIEEICDQWQYSQPENYALKLTEPIELYITEKNRNELKNGSVLKLAYSPTKMTTDIMSSLEGKLYEAKTKALEELTFLASDITFAQEFISQTGLAMVMDLIEQRHFTGPLLTNLLRSLAELMDHGGTSWDVLSEKLISEVAGYVAGRAKMEHQQTLTAALGILESLTMNSTANLPIVISQAPIANLIRHLDNSDPQVQQNALALINALFMKASLDDKPEVAELLRGKAVRSSLVNSVFARGVGGEMEHQLYVLQTLLLNMLEERMRKRLSSADTIAMEKLAELRRIAFDAGHEAMSPGSVRKMQSAHAKEYKKLGFRHFTDPAEDFQEAPPGLLALDCMHYYATEHTEAYTRMVLENSCRTDHHECPFAVTALRLTTLCAEILDIGGLPSETGQAYFEMLFKHERPFFEFFSVCTILLNKTWREMHASLDDLDKVISVVKEQITRSLQVRPKAFHLFQEEVNKYTYNEIQRIWQQERSLREEVELKAQPILELKDMMKNDIIVLIRLNRLNTLKEGKVFTKYGKGSRGAREKSKFCFWKLSSNEKTFYFDDCDEKASPSLDGLKNSLTVAEIEDLFTGKDCPLMKDPKNKNLVKTSSSLAFSLQVENADEFYNFVADSETTFNLWTDGINALLGREMISKQTSQDLDMLLGLELKIRLLDAEGVEIPNEPPPVPPPPANFDFFY